MLLVSESNGEVDSEGSSHEYLPLRGSDCDGRGYRDGHSSGDGFCDGDGYPEGSHWITYTLPLSLNYLQRHEWK